jgi:tetratricopeptide (TPR) repeat protein
MTLPPRAFKGLSRFLAPASGGPVADRALAEGLLNHEQLQDAVAEQDRTGRPLDQILVDRGILRPDQVQRLRNPAEPVEVGAAAEDPSRVVGRYVLVDRVGVGGMAEVWKAWDRSLGRWVALKFLKEEISHSTQRLEREGRMAGTLSHPSIVSIFERGHHGDRAFLVMPFVDGRSPEGPLPPREAARVALAAAEALSYVHGRGIVHRDVKPGNLLVDVHGRVLLADFGLAIPAASAVSRWAVSGTPEYASPEQVEGGTLDARTDVYSLGATLYQLLAGVPPFTGADAAEVGALVLAGKPAPLPKTPRRLRRIVARAMARDRETRYPTMEAFAAELRAFRDSLERRPRFSPAFLATLLLAVLLPWGLTLGILRERQDAEARLARARLLSVAARALARAEQLRADASVPRHEVQAAVLEAVTPYRIALAEAEGALPEAELGVARCSEIVGLDADAEGHYRNLPELSEARWGLARVRLRRHFEGRQDADWRRRAQEVLERGPRSRSAEACHRFLAGRAEDALAAAPPALGEDRYDDVLRLCLLQAALRLRRMPEALAHAEAVLRLRRSDSVSLYWKAVVLVESGDRAGAAEALERALKEAPRDWALRADAARRLQALR